MSAIAGAPHTYSGRRVLWRGPARLRAGTTRGYQQLLEHGFPGQARRAPKRSKWVHLRRGAAGTVGAVDQIITANTEQTEVVLYEVDFDNGVQISIELPCTLIAFGTPRPWTVRLTRRLHRAGTRLVVITTSHAVLRPLELMGIQDQLTLTATLTDAHDLLGLPHPAGPDTRAGDRDKDADAGNAGDGSGDAGGRRRAP